MLAAAFFFIASGSNRSTCSQQGGAQCHSDEEGVGRPSMSNNLAAGELAAPGTSAAWELAAPGTSRTAEPSA